MTVKRRKTPPTDSLECYVAHLRAIIEGPDFRHLYSRRRAKALDLLDVMEVGAIQALAPQRRRDRPRDPVYPPRRRTRAGGGRRRDPRASLPEGSRVSPEKAHRHLPRLCRRIHQTNDHDDQVTYEL